MIPTNTRIAVLHPQIKVLGGAMKQMTHLAKYLAKHNHVTFFSFETSKEIFSTEDSVTINSLFWKYPLKIFSFVYGAYKIKDSDYIFVWNSPMHFLAVLSKILFFSKSKIIWWHHHVPWYYWKRTGKKIYFKKIIEKLLLPYVDIIVWNSRFLQEYIQEIFNRDVLLLSPLIDSEYYDSNIEIKIPQEEKVLFAMSRWEKWKGIQDVFSVYEKLKKDFKLKLIVAGQWTELWAFEEKYKNDWKIEFVWKTNVSQNIQYFEQSDLFLFPSRIDSFGMTIVESLLCNTPVLAYSEWEASHLINNWENGYAVKNLEDLVSVSYKILKDDILYARLSQKSKKSIVSNYNVRHFESQLSTIFN